jgi:hypothetical protein
MPKTASGLGWLVQILADERIDACVIGETLLQDADTTLVRTIRQYGWDIEVVKNDHAQRRAMCDIQHHRLHMQTTPDGK